MTKSVNNTSQESNLPSDMSSAEIEQSKTICFISPCMNEQENLETLYNKLSLVRDEIYQKFNLESRIFFVDDGSTDATWDIIEKLSKKDPTVMALKLSRNFGKENALLAGFENAPKSDFYLTLDADLQDDPAVVSRLVEQAMEGYEIVYAQRASRTDAQWYIFCTQIFYKIMQMGSKIKFPPNVSDFYLITEKVRQAFLKMQESVRYTRGLVFYTGYSRIGVQYDRPDRNAGQSKFNFVKLSMFMLDAVTSFTSLPVHLISVIGLILSLFSFIIGFMYVFLSIFTRNSIPGWASMMSVSLFLGSVQILMIGVLAEYIARMSQELKARPKYFVAETLNNE